MGGSEKRQRSLDAGVRRTNLTRSRLLQPGSAAGLANQTEVLGRSRGSSAWLSAFMIAARSVPATAAADR